MRSKQGKEYEEKLSPTRALKYPRLMHRLKKVCLDN
jgi:hypothetical protein